MNNNGFKAPGGAMVPGFVKDLYPDKKTIFEPPRYPGDPSGKMPNPPKK